MQLLLLTLLLWTVHDPKHLLAAAVVVDDEAVLAAVSCVYCVSFVWACASLLLLDWNSQCHALAKSATA